jgi:hypothetical protein
VLTLTEITGSVDPNTLRRSRPGRLKVEASGPCRRCSEPSLGVQYPEAPG